MADEEPATAILHDIGADEAAMIQKEKTKRPARERKKKERFVLLHSMTLDERKQFLLDEAAQKVANVEKMQRALEASLKGETFTHQRIIIDLQFDTIMNDKEIRSLSKQLKLSYGSIKQMVTPFQLLLCNPSTQLQQDLERFQAKKWAVRWCHDRPLTDLINPSELVYLSPDSPNVLTSLDISKAYVIGGIVDKSRKKGATLEAATVAGIQTARLPIQEYITERLDHILNVNTVIDVLIKFQACDNWREALTTTLPQRKQRQAGRKARKRHGQQDENGSSVDSITIVETNYEVHDKACQIELSIDNEIAQQDPCTYKCPSNGQAFPTPLVSNRNGTFGSHRLPNTSGNTKSSGRSLNDMQPCPWAYSPQIDGQFPPAYTSGAIQAIRAQSVSIHDQAQVKQRRRYLKQGCSKMPDPRPHGTLGPGSYEVDKDWNQEKISTPFSFGKEKRRGIIDFTKQQGQHGFSPGPGAYHPETASIAVPSASGIANSVLQAKHISTFISRVRSESQLEQQQQQEAAKYSAELATSYQEMTKSVKKLERQMSTPNFRHTAYQRFDKEPQQWETYRCGSGTYNDPRTFRKEESQPITKSILENGIDQDLLQSMASAGFVNEEKLKVFGNELGASKVEMETQNGPMGDQRITRGCRRKKSTIGSVESRDLLRSVTTVDHIDNNSLGCEGHRPSKSTLTIPTYNLCYKMQEQHQEHKTKMDTSASTRLKIARSNLNKTDACHLTQKEMWKLMRHGPKLLPSAEQSRLEKSFLERNRQHLPAQDQQIDSNVNQDSWLDGQDESMTEKDGNEKSSR